VGQRDDLVEPIARALESLRGSRRRTANGEQWLDCRCPLHDDAHRSASFSLDQGTFICPVCEPGSSIPLDRVAGALSVNYRPDSNGSSPKLGKLAEILVEAARWSYDYYWPNAELSHRHVRIQYHNLDPVTGKPKKRYLHQAPSGDWNRPATYYPIYSDLGLSTGTHIVITEGEPPCDAVNASETTISGIGVHAITAGSTSDLTAARQVLVERLRELAPASITLWPDADEPGIKAMRAVQRILREVRIPAVLLKPEDCQLANKDDAVEFLQRGGNLGLLLSSLHRPTGPTAKGVAESITVLRDGALWPGTQSLDRIEQGVCGAMWQAVTGHMPADREAKELTNILRHRAATEPTNAYWRLRTVRDQVYWLPDLGRDCWRMSAEGLDLVAGPDDGIMLSPGPAVVPTDVDLTQDGEGYYRQLCDQFGLSELERALVLAWWICCLTGRETPIMLMRGPAGTGKSTLASFILGLVEPSLREIQVPDQRSWVDDRQLIATLRQVPALLADNVTALGATMEDALSKLVTGYNASVMWKYSNQVEQIRMRRGIVLTTTTYDVYKGDLASRMIVVNPAVEQRIDRDVLNERYMPMLPAIRGWVFKLICRTFLPHSPESSFRVASLGEVLQVLGYDARSLAAQEAEQKARILNQNDPWLWALVDIWRRHNDGGEFLFSHSQIVQEMREYGVPFEVLPQMGSSRFSRWVEEKFMILRDHGFWMERYKDRETRGYWFRRVK